MIYFGIPLRSRAASKDWRRTCAVFRQTLRSVCSQRCGEFRVIVACHEIPKGQYDERVEFIRSTTRTPQTPEEMMMDKGYKMSLIADRIREYGGGYTMMVDSDDLVSDRIAGYVHDHPGENGFLSPWGYVWEMGSPWMKRTRSMHRICGSCSIVCYRPQDLPDHLPEDLEDDWFKDVYPIRMPHRDIPDQMAKLGRPLARMPFPTTVYVRSTGDNHSMLGGSDLGPKRKLLLALSPRIPITPRLRREFWGKKKD